MASKNTKRGAKNTAPETTTAIQASKNVYKKTGDPINPSFWFLLTNKDVQNTLYIIDLDKGPLSMMEQRKIKNILAAKGKVAFETKQSEADALKMMQKLGLDTPNEKGKTYLGRAYLICENGGKILASTKGSFVRDADPKKNDVDEITLRAPRRKQDGSYQKVAGNIVMDPAAQPRSFDDYENKQGAWIAQAEGNINAYIKAHKDANIVFDRDNFTISIKGGTREEQVLHAREIAGLTGFMHNEAKNGTRLSDREKEAEKYGVSYTDEGLVICPVDNSVLNAEKTIMHAAGIKFEHVRKQVSSIQQINNNIPLNEFYNMLPAPQDDRSYTEVEIKELKESGKLAEISDRLLNVDLDAITVDPKTRHGTYIAHFRLLSNRKSLKQLHKDYEMYMNRLYKDAMIDEDGKSLVDVFDDQKAVDDALIAAMMPAYDVPELKKVPYFVPYSAYQKAVEAKDGAIVKKFEDQMVWQHETNENVMHFLLNVPESVVSVPKPKGKVSSFLYNSLGKETLPVPEPEKTREFLLNRRDALTKLELISQSLVKIEDPQTRAFQSAVFSGFMLEIERNIKKGYTQQEVFDKIIQFANERDYIIAEAPAQQAEEQQNDDTLTPPSPAPEPEPQPEPEPIPEEEATNEDTAEDEDAAELGLGGKGGTGGGSPVVEEEKKEIDYDQAYINQEILRQSLAANEALASNLLGQYQERLKKGEYADDSAMFNAFRDDPVRKYLASQKKIISDQLEGELKDNPTVEGKDEHITVNAKQISVAAYYSAVNNATNMCNDFITKQAEINNVEPMLLSAFVKSDIDKNPAYQQMQYQVVEGIDDVDLRVIKDPNVHNILDQTNKAFKGNVEVRDDVTEDPRFAMMADLTTAQIEAHNAQIEPIVKDIITREAEKETKAVIEETPEDEEKHKKEKTAKRTPIKKHPKKEVKEEDTATKEKNKKNVAKKTVKKKSKKPQPLYDTVRKQIKNAAKAPRVDNSFQQDGYKASGKNIDKKPTKDTKSTEIAEADEIMQMEACMTQRLQLTYLEMTTDANDVAKRSAIRQKINDLPPIPRSQIGTMVRILNYKDYKDKDLSPIERDIRERLAPLQEQVAKEREKIDEEKAKKAAEEAKTNEESDVKVLGK